MSGENNDNRNRLVVVSIAISLLMLSACGGNELAGTSSLGFRVLWQEAPVSGSLQIGRHNTARAASFGSTIPAAVNTVRIQLRASGINGSLSCCVAVRRGSQAFADRSLTLAALPAGDLEVSIAGYASDFAPADGVTAKCATRPDSAGTACDGDRGQLASFGSAPATVTVQPAERADAGDILMYPLPFLIGLQPEPDASVDGPQLPIRFTVVSAIHDVVANSVGVQATPAGARSAATFNLRSSTVCDDATANPCSPGGNLEVRGLLIDGLIDGLTAGTANVSITARNDDTPQRNMSFQYPIVVNSGASTTTTLPTTTSTSSTTSSTTTTSTTTTSTTSSTTTSTTTNTTGSTTSTSTTSTTLLAAQRCTITFGVTNAVSLVGLTFDVDYSAARGTFPGAADLVACRANPGIGVAGAFNNDVANSVLILGIVSIVPFNGPVDVIDCDFTPSATPVSGDFAISVNDAIAPNLAPTVANVGITSIACPP